MTPNDHDLSMSLAEMKGNKSKTQDAPSDKDIALQRALKEYSEKYHTLKNSFQKISQDCRSIKPESKEQGCKQAIKQLEGFQSKLSQLKQQVQHHSKKSNVVLKLAEMMVQLSQEATILKALCKLDQGLNYESIQEFTKIQGMQSVIGEHSKEPNSLSSDQLLMMNMHQQAPVTSDAHLKQSLLGMSIA